VGYTIYFYGEEVEVLPPEAATYLPDCTTPCKHNYSITAMYDLAPFGFPGEYGESGEIQTEYIVRFGYPLDFLEDWSSGSFETNNWTTEGPNWTINGQDGNPLPTAEFTCDPLQTNYDIGIESYPLMADSIFAGQIYLDFDIKLDEYLSTGTEMLVVGLWDWEGQAWMAIDTFSNSNGSFDWVTVHLDISDEVLGTVFKIKFSAKGEASLNILSWFIDNIHVYRDCEAPDNLSATGVYYNSIMVEWDPIVNETWMHYDDGGNYTSVGTVGQIEFDAAVRWTPDQLQPFNGALLTKVAFFPVESVASFNIRVWTGQGAETLVVDQPVENPVFDVWNFIELETPVALDITQELWVGYHVLSTWGYPAGCDDGPAIDGYGNMIKYGSWKTLLEMNPELNYNWNIQAYIMEMPEDTVNYAVYRSDDAEPFFLRAVVDQNFYVDDSVCGIHDFHSYKVTALHIHDNDTCESGFSNEGFEICGGIQEDETDFDLNIYPNPANDLLTIESSEVMGYLSLYDYNGRLIFRKEIADRNLVLPMKEYPEGVYLLRVETGSGVVFRKVIVMR
jgi:hypothetical protein